MPENKTEVETISAFANRIAEDAQLDGMTPEQKASLQQQIRDGADAVVESALIDALSDEQLIELNELLDNNAADDELDAFFASAGVDFGRVAGEALVSYRHDVLTNLAELAESED